MATANSFHDFVKELFARLGPIQIKRMFGGAGGYADGPMFLLLDGEAIYLKADAALKEELRAEGSGPFIWEPKNGPRAGEKIPLRGMRKTIATRMHQSLQSTAQLTMNMDVRMDDAVRLREQLVAEWASEGVKPSYTDLVVRAVTKALAQHPRMNSAMGDGEIALLRDVHVGIAVALDEGLVVPVIRNTSALSVKEIAQESARLVRLAREGKLSMDDYAGGTFSVSTLGMFGVDTFTPILNPPQSGILGVNRIRDDVGWDGDRPVKRKAMMLSLTWDHRVLDGEPAARFLASVRDLLEAPYRLLV